MAEGNIPKMTTILVVDDEAAVREFIRLTLTRRGFKVIVASNGVEALLLCGRRERIHLLIADLHMPPYMDGLELAKAMRRQWAGLAVLYISGNLPDASVEEETSEKLAVFLGKPFLPDELIRTVHAMLGLKAPRMRAAPARLVAPRTPRKAKRCILLLVPEPDLRHQVSRLLRHEGYLVLEAAHIGEALCITQWHVGAIGLLLADSEALSRLPSELPERLAQGRPHMRILCASACGLQGVPLMERVRLTLEQWGIEAIEGP